jgi:hypothetical protein
VEYHIDAELGAGGEPLLPKGGGNEHHHWTLPRPALSRRQSHEGLAAPDRISEQGDMRATQRRDHSGE